MRIVSYIFSLLKLPLGVDTSTGAIFCSECDDFIYEPSLDTEYKRTLLAVDEINAHFLRSSTHFLD